MSVRDHKVPIQPHKINSEMDPTVAGSVNQTFPIATVQSFREMQNIENRSLIHKQAVKTTIALDVSVRAKGRNFNQARGGRLSTPAQRAWAELRPGA